MSILLLNVATQQKIDNLIIFATTNPLTLDSMEDRVQGNLPAIGSDPKHCIDIYKGYRCCYSHEPDREGRLVHHLSVSMIDQEGYPSKESIEALLEAFGFAGKLGTGKLMTYPESSATGSSLMAVNIVEYLPKTSTKH